MINKERGGQYIECDDCGEQSNRYDSDEFRQMVSEAKDDGWQVTRTEDGWEHRCADCAGNRSSGLAHARKLFGYDD